jgi:hypothetical protein
MKWFMQTNEPPKSYAELADEARNSGNPFWSVKTQMVQLPDGRVGYLRDIRDGVCRVEADSNLPAKIATGWHIDDGKDSVSVAAVRVISNEEYYTWRRMLTEGRWVTRAQKEAADGYDGVIGSDVYEYGIVRVCMWDDSVLLSPSGEATWADISEQSNWQQHNQYIIANHGTDAIRLQ